MAKQQHSAISLSGKENGVRIESRILEERIQQAVAAGASELHVEAFGQHGVGGRLWVSKQRPIKVKVTGTPGQRLGAMGFPGTLIETDGPASSDTGWLNAGAEIVVHGAAGDGCCNAMAQGKVLVAGNTGARAMTMTKQNPRMTAPELWVLDYVGDYFAEFMAGGVAVVCGADLRDRDNVLGFRPCVGMVGGRIFFRGPHLGYSTADAKMVDITDADWEWLSSGLKDFLARIGKSSLYKKLAKRQEWSLIVSKSPHELLKKKRRGMAAFRSEVWDRELGRGGLIGDLTEADRSPIGLINTGELRQMVPVWENCKHMAPCQAKCPTGIPVRRRWKLIREDKMEEALELAMAYTPFPASICGYLCPNLCRQACTRGAGGLLCADMAGLGRASLSKKMPDLPALGGKKVAVIGGGPAGISVAWQLRLMGHEATVMDLEKELGGKIQSVIPSSRLPQDILKTELGRIRKVIPHVQLKKKLDQAGFAKLVQDFDYVVLAAGAQKPRLLPVPGKELLTTATDFLRASKADKAKPGKTVVIIGAGNVGCDVATEAFRLGATSVQLIDIQKPAAFGKEREEAEHLGATFRYPCFTKEITRQGVVLTSGELIPADTVIVSIGDAPDLDFLTGDIAVERGFVTVNELYQTTNPKVFAIGDIVKIGLLTEAVGAGRKAALAMDEMLRGTRPESDTRDMRDHSRLLLEYASPEHFASDEIDYSRMHLEYFDPRRTSFEDLHKCADECASCGECRDCGVCENICPRGAITRKVVDDKKGGFEMVSDPALCIGCGFCAGACPCGIWAMQKNTPLE